MRTTRMLQATYQINLLALGVAQIEREKRRRRNIFAAVAAAVAAGVAAALVLGS